jgi:hypothetical protein
MFFVLTFVAVTMSSFMDTIKHHYTYKTVFWRRYGWHKAGSGWRLWAFKFIEKQSASWLQNDAWHWAKRVFIVSLIFTGVFLTKIIEAGVSPDIVDYMFLVGLVFNAVWCFMFWALYNSWMVHRKKIRGQWYEWAKDDGGNKYYFPLGSDEDPYI